MAHCSRDAAASNCKCSSWHKVICAVAQTVNTSSISPILPSFCGRDAAPNAIRPVYAQVSFLFRNEQLAVAERCHVAGKPAQPLAQACGGLAALGRDEVRQQAQRQKVVDPAI